MYLRLEGFLYYHGSYWKTEPELGSSDSTKLLLSKLYLFMIS